METVSLPSMTLWQFYGELGVQTVLGVLFCWALYRLGARDPRLGWKPGKVVAWLQDKMMYILLFAAGIASFELLPTLYYSFINDVSEVAAEAVVNTAGDAIKGTLETPDAQEVTEMITGVVWGEMSEQQHEDLTLMSAFWLFIGWCCYLLTFCASPVNWFKKFIKIVGYCCLSSVILLAPMCVHQFTWDEIEGPVWCLILAGVCIAATHSWTRKMPPPLPD